MKPRKTTFLIISSEFPPGPGGIGQHAFSMIQAIPNSSEITILTNQDYASESQSASFNQSLPKNCKLVLFQSRASKLTPLKRIQQAFKLTNELKPNLVIATGLFPLWIGGLLKITHAHLRVVGIAHGSEISASGGLTARITAFFYRRLDSIVAVSRFTAKLLHPKTNPEKVKIVPNGLEAHTLGLQFEPTSHFMGKPALLTVGNLTPRKGQHRVVNALPTILKQLPDLHYHMVGLPTTEAEIKKRALNMGVEKAISIHGRVASREALLKVYTQADIFIMLSENQNNGDVEGFGIAILEANAFGIPAIGAKGCGIEDAISENSGILVDGDDASDITQAIKTILSDYDRYSKGARLWAEKHNWNNLIKDILEK